MPVCVFRCGVAVAVEAENGRKECEEPAEETYPESDDEVDLHAVYETCRGHYLDEFTDSAVYCESGRCGD